MKLRDVMVKKPQAVVEDDSLGHAANLMVWMESRHLPVLAGGRCSGVLSQRDILRFRAENPGSDWQNQPVSVAMSHPAQTASPDDAVTEASSRLAHQRIGCLPITERGALVGLVTVADILLAEVQRAMDPPAPSGPTVGEAMTRDPHTASPGDRLLDAAGRMQSRGIRHLPVVDGNGALVGLLSDRDVRAAIGDPADAFAGDRDSSIRIQQLQVEHAMAPNLVTVGPGELCSDVARQFATLRASAVPVEGDDGKLVGILSYVDLLRVLAA